MTSARLVELCVAYREAHAVYTEALQAAEAAFVKRSRSWERLADEQRTAEAVLREASDALLAAAIEIGDDHAAGLAHP